MVKKLIVMTIALFFTLTGVVMASPELFILEAPKNLTVEVKNHEDGKPYFELKVETPQSVEQIGQQIDGELTEMFYIMESKVGNGDWVEMGPQRYSEGPNFVAEAVDMGINGNIDIKANKYYFRVRYEYLVFEISDEYGNRSNTATIESPCSNIATIGIGDYQVAYKEASTWAVPELDKAAELGFITDRIKDKMNGPITREEFCEIVVRLYEKLTESPAVYDNMDAFNDTKNPEIFKANKLGIVDGVGEGKFAPNNLVTREQVATMMRRAVEVIKPFADFSTDEAGTFADGNLISSWALDAVKFMNKNGLMKGSDGEIDPKGTTTREQAVLLVLRTYEKYNLN